MADSKSARRDQALCSYLYCFNEARPGRKFCRSACAPLAARLRDRITLTRKQRRKLEDMRAELEGNKLSVILIPADEVKHCGHMIRAVEEASPEWYKDFCSLYAANRTRRRHRRKFDTRIKRALTLRAFDELLNQGLRHSTYALRLLDFIR